MVRILIIEDDCNLRRYLGDVLRQRKADVEVFEAENGAEALTFLESTPVDLVVTDIFMPQEDGLGAIMEIRQNTPQTRIIAISGGGSVDSVDFLELASNLGAQRTMQKPFGSEEFIETVEELLTDKPFKGLPN